MNIQFETLDPRPSALPSVLERISTWHKEGKKVIGFEVTVPQQAEMLDLNIDPQHTGGNSEMSCIMECFENPPSREREEVVYCTSRADLDSVGAMALSGLILDNRSYDAEDLRNIVRERVGLVHQTDCFDHGEWSPKELFSQGYEQPKLAAIARAVSDFKISLETRVQWMSDWLIGINPEDVHPLAAYQAAYEKEKEQVKNALENGSTKVTTYKDLVVVTSKLRAATSIGYAKSPVVIAFNPEMPARNGSYKKFTVCQYRAGYIDLAGAVKALNELEPGWGGSPTIIGSPQEQDSSLTIDQVMKIVRSFAIIRPSEGIVTSVDAEAWALASTEEKEKYKLYIKSEWERWEQYCMAALTLDPYAWDLFMTEKFSEWVKVEKGNSPHRHFT
jgi:hypothetical protein